MDLKRPALMYLKAILFIVIAGMALAMIALLTQDWRIVALSCLSSWACCRLYYFCFYVIEKYIDADFKFAGLWSVIRYLARRRRI